MSDHSEFPLEVDSAPKDHKATYSGTVQNGRFGMVPVIFALLVVIYVFGTPASGITLGVLATLGFFKMMGGRWITTIMWGLFAIVLFMLVNMVSGWIG